jgi:hypothetical protein
MKNTWKPIAYAFLIIALPFLLIQCKNNKPKETGADTTLTDEKPDTSNKAIAIFYEMMLPSEISLMFEKTGAIYNPQILNPLENMSNYSTNPKAALNLGVYGVDLGYVKIFNQAQKSIKYFAEIHELSKQIGIPEDYFIDGISYFQKKMNNRDSISFIANRVYNSTHEYLQKNDRPESAALIILGGWVEAMYISAMILKDDKTNKEIVKRIAGQKYSLNTLISYLNNYRSDITVSKYLLMLKVLKKSYEKVDISFDKGTMEKDTVRKMIHSESYKVEVTPQALDEITKIISGIRAEIIS